MAKQQILLVDADSSSARVLEVSLRSAGFTVTSADSAESALEKLEHGCPDLILTDTRLPGADGFAFVRGLRARPEFKGVPIVFLTEQGALEDKLRGLELGVDDYLAKPIFVREVVTRVHMLLARKNQQRIATESLARTRFSGSLEDVAVVDLLQTIAISGKSGVAVVRRGDREALLYFRSGQLVDAEVGDLRGEEAVYRTITWTTGTFDLEFRPVDRPAAIEATMNALLMEGLRRVDELGRLAEQLPPENTVIDIDHDALLGRLNEIPDELNGILRLIDGKRTLLDLIDGSPFDDLSTLTVLSKFYFEGLLVAIEPPPEAEGIPASSRASSIRPGAADAAGVVLGRSTPAGRSEIPPPVAVVDAAARPSASVTAAVPPATPPPRAVAPSTRRAPEPPPVRVTGSEGEELRVPLAAAADIGPMADKPTLPAPSAPAPEPRSSLGAPGRPALSGGDPLKVTPKVILNVGDEGVVTPSKAAPGRPSAGASSSPSHARSVEREPAASNGHHTNGLSGLMYAAPAGVELPGAIDEASAPAHTPAIGTLRPAAEPSTPSPHDSPPRDIGAHLSATPWAGDSGESSVFTPAPPQAIAREDVGSEPLALARRTPRSSGGEVTEVYVSQSGAFRDTGEGAPPPLPIAEQAPEVDEDTSGREERISEAEFFDAGDEGTYAGGPRSSIPAAEEDYEPESPPPVGYRSTPAQQERLRRSTRLVAAVLAAAAVPLFVAVWRNVGSDESEATAARESLSEISVTTAERGANERLEPSSSTPSLTPAPRSSAPESVNPPVEAAAAAAAPDPEVVEAAAAVATPAAALAAGSEELPASAPDSEPVAVPAAPRAVPPAPKQKASEAPVAKAERSVSPEPAPRAAPKRRRATVAAPPAPASAPKPVVSAKPEPELPAVPRRSSSDKPPTAAFPQL